MTIDLRNRVPGTAPLVNRTPETPQVQSAPDVRHAHVMLKRNREQLVLYIAAGCAALFVVVLLYLGISKLAAFAFSGEGSEREVRALVASVGDHMLLPHDETPTVATVSDLHALEDQLFFQNAEFGDKVLMYMQAQKAILYRPSTDLIIEVGPITGAE